MENMSVICSIAKYDIKTLLVQLTMTSYNSARISYINRLFQRTATSITRAYELTLTLSLNIIQHQPFDNVFLLISFLLQAAHPTNKIITTKVKNITQNILRATKSGFQFQGKNTTYMNAPKILFQSNTSAHVVY